MQNPLKYYKNNVNATGSLFDKMIECGNGKFILSSMAATYGMPETDLITEDTETNPTNPYDKSKLMIEDILDDLPKVNNFEYIVLCYFNAAGAHTSGEVGETHLIPIVLEHLLGEREKTSVFGTGYHTPDGTCVRDYIHVTDLANALYWLMKEWEMEKYQTMYST